MTLPLNPKEKQELARIMLRCAMWVSISDEAGGNSSQNAEERVLKRRIQTLYKSARTGTDEREILGIILSNTQYWRVWCEDLISLMPEIRAASSRFPVAMRKIALGLATDVATAFEERSAVSSFLMRTSLRFKSMFSKSNSYLSPEERASISASEMAALKELALALEIPDFHI
ncbi:MAG: hypothetical protein RBR86_09635 [Pseudobdellovibrionaceae bacterium]|jgi:hypothetical protein|nr:hypothetical protein [Pseudobdellovibrionaceae bacterium]